MTLLYSCLVIFSSLNLTCFFFCPHTWLIYNQLWHFSLQTNTFQTNIICQSNSSLLFPRFIVKNTFNTAKNHFLVPQRTHSSLAPHLWYFSLFKISFIILLSKLDNFYTHTCTGYSATLLKLRHVLSILLPPYADFIICPRNS